MSFFGKFFKTQHPLDSLRLFVRQRRWADALVEGEVVVRSLLQIDEINELDQLLAAAGDALAKLNLGEGEAFLRAGDAARANEHFTLAAAQARDPEVSAKALEFLSAAAPGSVSLPIPAKASCCPTGCGSLPDAGQGELSISDLDAQTHLDLLLGSYPQELADRYAGISGPFLQAFLLAHEGHFAEALDAFEQVPETERSDLFFFERGSLLACNEEDAAAKADLELALTINPRFNLAGQTLVNLEMSLGRFSLAEDRLRKMLQGGMNTPFALGRLAGILASRGNATEALEHALRALDCGADTETFALAASLLEGAGRLDEAEACLTHLATPGCGGLNPALAEFWLRQQKNAEKALETFKSALRKEPKNPRWMLRVAQAYHACGWGKEGFPLLQSALQDRDLDPQLRSEALALQEVTAP